MYVPPAFQENDPNVLWPIVQSLNLGLLISQSEGNIIANALPFEVQQNSDSVVLLAHLAKANQQWHDLDGQNVLVVFQGTNAYVSPQWYASKKEHGRVVPTWNYAMVQVRGTAHIINDHDWLRGQVERLTDRHEATVKDGNAWQVSDAPSEYIASQIKGIVGLKIEVSNLSGKLKLSQNRSEADQAGVIKGLANQKSLKS